MRIPLGVNGGFGSKGIVLLVDGDAGFIESLFRLLAIDAFRKDVHEHQVCVRTAGHDPEVPRCNLAASTFAFRTTCRI